jgi:hypothetical protein
MIFVNAARGWLKLAVLGLFSAVFRRLGGFARCLNIPIGPTALIGMFPSTFFSTLGSLGGVFLAFFAVSPPFFAVSAPFFAVSAPFFAVFSPFFAFLRHLVP